MSSWASAIVVELVERDPHLARKREQRRAQQGKGDDKQDADEKLVPDPTKALANARMTSTVVQIPLPTER